VLADRLLPLPVGLEDRLLVLGRQAAAQQFDLAEAALSGLHPVLARADQNQIAARGRRRDVVADEAVQSVASTFPLAAS
jgi:hypothetical protein